MVGCGGAGVLRVLASVEVLQLEVGSVELREEGLSMEEGLGEGGLSYSDSFGESTRPDQC